MLANLIMKNSNCNTYFKLLWRIRLFRREFERGLRNCIDINVHTKEVIELQINIDGFPLFKSSTKNFWPILCRVHFESMIYKPFPITVSGNSKPQNVSEYLKKFVEEINYLQSESIEISKKLLKIKIKCFICDTPACAYIKGIKGHSGFHYCERCTGHFR